MNRFIIVILMSYMLLTSCGFYSMAGSIPPHIKTVAIPLMDNETAEFGLAEALTDGLLKRFNEEGILEAL